mmetsp:Transcript_25050/g.48641  ORF Transcript_25050/g.48641 Transcript_25050/m.48641 type:complete len:360 (-) Transcript_25050:338-1417(-)
MCAQVHELGSSIAHMRAARLGCSVHSGDGLLSGIVQVVGGDDAREARSLDDLFAQIDVRALEAHDERDLEANFLDRTHDTLGNDVALHDAAEDVDEDGLDAVVGGNDLEGGRDLLALGAAADVEEVGRLPAVGSDDVHRRHREARAVDHASDVAVEADVVEVPLVGSNLARVLLRGVTLREDRRLSEGGVVVEANLRVRGEELAILVLCQRVDLDHRAVQIDEELVERLNLVHRLGLVAGDLEALDNLHRLRVGDADVDVHRHLDNLLRRRVCEVLDGGAALGARDHQRPHRRAVQHDRKVHLLDQLHLLGQQHGVDGLALGPRLLRDQVVAQHLGRVLRNLRRLDHVHAALEAALERA